MLAEQALVQLPSVTASFAVLAEECYAGAYRALQTGDDHGAQVLFGLMTILAPRDERCWLGLGMCAERQGDYQRAKGMYEAGCALASDAGWCRLGDARALDRLGRHYAAAQALDDAEASAADPALLSAIRSERGAS